MTARVSVLLILAAIIAMPEGALAQCPMCRQALMSTEAQGLAAAFRSGILFLLAAPFTVFAAVATVAVRAERRRRLAANAELEPGTENSARISVPRRAESHQATEDNRQRPPCAVAADSVEPGTDEDVGAVQRASPPDVHVSREGEAAREGDDDASAAGLRAR
jgi:hypothetical protein